MCQIDVCTCTRLFETMPSVQPPTLALPPFLRAHTPFTIPTLPPPGPCPSPCPIILCVLSRLNPYHPPPPPPNHPVDIVTISANVLRPLPTLPLFYPPLSCPSSSSSSFLPAVCSFLILSLPLSLRFSQFSVSVASYFHPPDVVRPLQPPRECENTEPASKRMR